ncbi:MAG: acylneuraminate cytidylyltransferase family protein [Paraglaciecola sp.]|uniref:acylneuraminate cytidylyltransferase family protein n=1 Tax=Paraglaciecola sp. TaxID=1920173 RepID=UPI003297C68A
MNIICIIPARGGSKGIPKKNIQSLAEKPLIQHSIQQAKDAEGISAVYVTTDDEVIASIATQVGSQVITRPESLSGDTASSESALLHALTEIEQKGEVDYVVFLQCTSPFRAATDIDNAINIIRSENSDSLLSVVDNHRFLWRNTNNGAESINYDFQNRPRRQDMEVQYMENGSIYIFKPWVLKELNNRLGGKVSIYVMDEKSAIDIDTAYDFKLAKAIFNLR